MPYHIVKEKGYRPYKIKKGRTIVGSSTSRRKAEASIRIRERASKE